MKHYCFVELKLSSLVLRDYSTDLMVLKIEELFFAVTYSIHIRPELARGCHVTVFNYVPEMIKTIFIFLSGETFLK